MVHESAAMDGSPIMEGLLKRIEHEAGMGRSTDPPTYDPSRVGIDHKGDVNEAGPGRDVGEVRDPQHVRPRCSELAVHVIQRHGADLSLIVVRTGLPRITPCKPMVCIRRSTVQRATPHECGPRERICLSFCSSWLHLLKSWSLRSTRGGSEFWR